MDQVIKVDRLIQRRLNLQVYEDYGDSQNRKQEENVVS